MQDSTENTVEPNVGRETISDFGVYVIESSRGSFPGLWVRHGTEENAFEYPLAIHTEETIFCTADPAFVDNERKTVSEDFYKHLGFHISRLMHEGEYVIDDFWAWLPDELSDAEGKCIYHVLRMVDIGFLSFEIQELVERSLQAAGEDAGIEEVQEIEIDLQISEDAFNWGSEPDDENEVDEEEQEE